MLLILICAKQSFTFRRRPKRAAASPLAPLRQSYPLPSPNACRLQNRRWQCAPRTSGWPKMRFVGCAPLQRQHFCGSAGALLGLSPAPGAHFDKEWCYRLSSVLILLTYVVMSTILGWQNGALACARCAFWKLSSRLRAVRIFTLSVEKQMFLVHRPRPACPLRTCHRALTCAANQKHLFFMGKRENARRAQARAPFCQPKMVLMTA